MVAFILGFGIGWIAFIGVRKYPFEIKEGL